MNINPFDTTQDRSDLMRKIRSNNTGPEIIVRKALSKLGFRFRLNYTKLPGKPDIVLVKYKLAIFIDGEFWHGYRWEEKKERIKSNRDYWINKIERNIKRDNIINAELLSLDYKVFRFWEHEIKKDLNQCINKIIDHINSMK